MPSPIDCLKQAGYTNGEIAEAQAEFGAEAIDQDFIQQFVAKQTDDINTSLGSIYEGLGIEIPRATTESIDQQIQNVQTRLENLKTKRDAQTSGVVRETGETQVEREGFEGEPVGRVQGEPQQVQEEVQPGQPETQTPQEEVVPVKSAKDITPDDTIRYDGRDYVIRNINKNGSFDLVGKDDPGFGVTGATIRDAEFEGKVVPRVEEPVVEPEIEPEIEEIIEEEPGYKSENNIEDNQMAEDGNIRLTTEAVNNIRGKWDLDKTKASKKTVDALLRESRDYISTDKEGFIKEDLVVDEVLRGNINGSIDAKMIAIRYGIDRIEGVLESVTDHLSKVGNDVVEKNRLKKTEQYHRNKLHAYTVAFNHIGTLGGRILRYRQEVLESKLYSPEILRQQFIDAKGGRKLTEKEEALVRRASQDLKKLQNELTTLHVGNAQQREAALKAIAQRFIRKARNKGATTKRIEAVEANLRKVLEAPC